MRFVTSLTSVHATLVVEVGDEGSLAELAVS